MTSVGAGGEHVAYIDVRNVLTPVALPGGVVVVHCQCGGAAVVEAEDQAAELAHRPGCPLLEMVASPKPLFLSMGGRVLSLTNHRERMA